DPSRPARRAPGGSPAAAGTRRAAGAGSSPAARRRPPRTGGSPRACASARAAPGPRGSGSSRLTRPGTRPAAAGRRRRSCAAWVPARSPSSREEDQAVLADLELVAGVEIGLLDPVPVQERAVQAAEILDREAARAAGDDRVPARHGDVVEKDVAVRRS